jgi:hypothetical protein
VTDTTASVGARSASLPPRVAAFLDAYDASGIAGHPDPNEQLTGALDHMHTADAPFPHGLIDGFLPLAFYRTLLESWPADAELAPVSLPGTEYVGARATRLVDARPASPDAWTPPDPAVVRLAAALRAPAFVRALFTRFADVVERNLQDLDVTQRDSPGFRLYLCRDAGEADALGAHLDALRKLLTIVVYMDLTGTLTAESDEAWGTALYPAGAEKITPVTFTPNAQHTALARVPFAPNRAFVMPNTARSLHGVAGGQADVTRRTLMCGYWLFKAD